MAFLGAGQMGSAMIRHLLKAGHRVAVYNRTLDRARPLQADGARLCASPREAVASASAIIAMVIDDAASRDCWTGENGVLSANLQGDIQAIECSSLSRGWILELARRGLGKFSLIDCPVAGRPDAAAAGRLKVFAGGREQDIARAAPLLNTFATSVTTFGPLGSGAAFKLIYNMLGASQIAALAEALAACNTLKIDPFAAAKAFCEGNTGSPHLIRHADWMVNHTHPQPAQFSGEGRIKDLTYVEQLLAEVGCSSLTARATLALFTLMRQTGMARENDSQLYETLLKQNAAPVSSPSSGPH